MASCAIKAGALLLGAGLASALPAASYQENAQQCLQSKVLILGAGMAGVSAGKALTEQGIDDFRIVEYQDRIGGRTLHTSFGKRSNGSSYTVELGTNWITGLHEPALRDKGMVNPIWPLAEEVNLTSVPWTDAGSRTLYDHKGYNNWAPVFLPLFKAESAIMEDAFDRVKNGKPDISIKVALGLQGWDPTNDMYKQAAEVLSFEVSNAAPIDQSSLIFSELHNQAELGPNFLGPDQQFVMDQRGYDIVTRHLAGKYLKPYDERLVLNSPVTNISYDDHRVVARTANNTCYRADYAICTFSLGVLQQAISGNAPVHFDPPFPEWKQMAVLSNVMGIYTKLFYQFPRHFWPHDVQKFTYASPTRRGYWITWESLDFTGSPLEGSNIIFGTMVWDQSGRVEQQSDEETKQEGLAVLRQMFPNETIPEPIAFTYPRWGMTPWAYGSYSNWGGGYTLEQSVNFRANLGRLWFAGEATSEEYPSCLPGALYEGRFAGEEIAACVAGNKSCVERNRYPKVAGVPERDYNHTNGFQHNITQLVGN